MRHSEENLQKILETLLENDGFVTLDDLSRMLDISKRSVQNYLVRADLWLREHELEGVKIIKKQGYGIQLRTSQEERQKLKELIHNQYFTTLDGSAKRRIEIVKNLVFSKEELTIQFLADQFYVSRFVILSDLDWVENWLAQYKLKLFKTQRRGIGIVGDEVSRRAAIAGFFDLREASAPVPSSRKRQNLKKLEEVYAKEDIQKVCSIIEEAEKEFDFYMGSEFFAALATHITISVFRLRHGCQLEKEFLPPDGEFPSLEMHTAGFMARKLEKAFSVSLPESERIYICIHLMSYNAFPDMFGKNQPMPENIEMLALHLIEAVDAEIGSNFAVDKMLFFGLLYHLRSAIYRLKENLGTYAQSGILLPEACQDIYDCICKNADLYRQYGEVEPDQKELTCVAFHFALSLERTIQKNRALVVSNSGILSQLKLRKELQDNLPQLIIVDACSSQQLFLCQEDRYDFIITTVSLENVTKPIANIAHMTMEQSVQFIEEFVFTKLDNNENEC